MKNRITEIVAPAVLLIILIFGFASYLNFDMCLT